MLTEDLLQSLVGFNTTSHRSNLEAIDYIRDYLGSLGIDSTLIHNEGGTKANLFATIGPVDKPGVMLSGHTDVVPVDGQNWSSEPFEATCVDDKWFGRGTADMKGFIACVLAAAPNMLKQKLETPIHIALSYDEEVGCLGVRRLIDMLKQAKTKPAMAIIGEPTMMKPVAGHKGKLGFCVTVKGKPGHSAYTADAVNAIEYAAHLIACINNIHRDRALSGPFDQGYQVPHTTLHTGLIDGGIALNIVPQLCEFLFEIRNIPTDAPEPILNVIKQRSAELVREMRAIAEDCDIKFADTINYPALNTDPSSQVVRFVQQLLANNASPQCVSFGTEAGLFSGSLGVPSVVCGPGDIAQAHKPDEFISKAQLSECDKFLGKLIVSCSQNTIGIDDSSAEGPPS